MSEIEPATRRMQVAGRRLPIFRTVENRAALMAMYDEALGRWPVPFKAFFVETRYGKTHVIASGKPTSPPLVLIHPMGVGSFVWASIIGPLVETHRVSRSTPSAMSASELSDPDRFPKKGRDYSGWLDDVDEKLQIATADLVAGSMGGWIAMNRAICAPDRVRRLVLLGPMGLPSWRTTLGVLGPMLLHVVHPTDAKLDRIIDRSLGDGKRVNREFRPWMRILGDCRPRVGQPIPIANGKLRTIKAPTLLFLGGKDGLVGNGPRRPCARRNIARCEIEILQTPGHAMSVDDPDFIGSRIAKFFEVTQPTAV